MIDLHQHSIFSDGTDSLEELIQKNKDSHIELFALTDHDTIDGCKKIIENHAKNKGIKFVPGIEFSTVDHGDTVHILAYDYDPADKNIVALIKKGIALRQKRVKNTLNFLKKQFGITLKGEQLAKIKASKNPNKPMIANFLIELGYGTSVSEMFKKYLYASFDDLKLTSEEVIKTLSKSQCLVVWAHPLGSSERQRITLEKVEEKLQRFTRCGLDGLECYHSYFSAEESQSLTALAKKYNLLISGGSDYHGRNKTVEIGQLNKDHQTVEPESLTLPQKFRNIYYL